MINALIEVAEDRGYYITWHKGGPKGAWLPHRHIVSLRLGMDDTETLCTLAHELGHAHYGDPPGHDGWREKRADRFAARILITPDEYAAAERLHGPCSGAIAHELGVTAHLIQAWRSVYEKVIVI